LNIVNADTLIAVYGRRVATKKTAIGKSFFRSGYLVSWARSIETVGVNIRLASATGYTNADIG
jgi:hypothetical protein